jgi:protein-serine/threonine kinase
MLASGVHSRMLDYYQIGALLYEILTGLPPNYSINKKQMFSNIVRNEPVYPSYLSNTAKNLL